MDPISFVLLAVLVLLLPILSLIGFKSSKSNSQSRMEKKSIFQISMAADWTFLEETLCQLFFQGLLLLRPCFPWCTILSFYGLFVSASRLEGVFLTSMLLQRSRFSYNLSNMSYRIGFQNILLALCPIRQYLEHLWSEKGDFGAFNRLLFVHHQQLVLPDNWQGYQIPFQRLV